MGVIKQFVALGGQARSGSTLLSCILSQNPQIHAGGSSAVCQLMWDMHTSINKSEEIKANKITTAAEIVSQIPNFYYKNINKPIIVDRNRSWSLPANVELLRKYIGKNVKYIVLTRPTVEVVSSIVNLRKINGWVDPEINLFIKDGEPIVRPLASVLWAKNNNNGEFIFISYNDLVENTEKTLEKIYNHCGWDFYRHDLNNIINTCTEDDYEYGLPGLHEIRSTIKRKDNKVILSKKTLDMCYELDNLLEVG